MDSIIVSLRRMNRTQLSKVIEKWGNESVEEYGQLWWQEPMEPPPLEPELTHLAKKQFELTCIQVIKTQTLPEKQVLRILGLRYFP